MERFTEKIALLSLDTASASDVSDGMFFGPPDRFDVR